ncbi:unnamed protein product [Alternaria alternata]
MESMNIFQWPWQILQYTINRWRISGGPSGQDLYQDCNDVIRDFERAFALENGWAAHDKELVFYLQEAALGLKQWKDSIRWCATPDHDCFSDEENEKLVQLVLTSLKEENLGLLETIGQHISEVAKLLVFIEQLYIRGDDEEASTWTDEKSGKLWLRDFLPGSQGFGNARVMTFSYVRPDLSRIETHDPAELWLKKLAKSLASHVMRIRNETNTPGDKPIMLIGHSLGGIIIKTALMMTPGHGVSIFYLTGNIVFFGTPCIEREKGVERHLTLQRIFEAAGVKQDEAVGASESLIDLTVIASRLFHRMSWERVVTSFYECRKYHGILIVNKDQASGNFFHETVIGLDANHHTMCQFASNDSEDFATVHQALFANLVEIPKALYD